MVVYKYFQEEKDMKNKKNLSIGIKMYIMLAILILSFVGYNILANLGLNEAKTSIRNLTNIYLEMQKENETVSKNVAEIRLYSNLMVMTPDASVPKQLAGAVEGLIATIDESIVCLSKLADTHIEMEIDPEELDTITAKVSPTYPEIKAYVLQHHGLKVSSLAIAQTKKKCGLEVGECYNLPSGHGRPPTNLTPEREAAIREAFQYYGLI